MEIKRMGFFKRYRVIDIKNKRIFFIRKVLINNVVFVEYLFKNKWFIFHGDLSRLFLYNDQLSLF